MSEDGRYRVLALRVERMAESRVDEHDWHVVLSADDAIAAAESHAWDVAVVHLGENDGEDFFERLRQTNHAATMPVILIGDTCDASVVAHVEQGRWVEWLPAAAPQSLIDAKAHHLARMSRRLSNDNGTDHDEEHALVTQYRHRVDELEQYLYCAAHDLKSPLMTFTGYLSHIRRDVDAGRTDRIGQFVDTIEHTAVRMRNIINDLLELCRVGHVARSFEPVDMNRLLRAVVGDYEAQLAAVGAEVDIAADLPRIQANEQLLRQLFENLLTNAIKYGAKGERPRIDFLYSMANQEHRFCVRDNGPGIDACHRERVFDLFQRLDSQDGNGTGVGLTLVRRIAEHHGGRAWVETAPHGGAAFWVAFKPEGSHVACRDAA